MHYSLCDNRMIICQSSNDQQFSHIESVLHNEQISQMEVNLTNGTYLVIIMSDYHGYSLDVVFSVLSSCKVSIQQLDYELNKEVFNQQIIDLVSKFGINDVFDNEVIGDQIFYRSLFSFKDGFVIEYIKNKSFTQTYRVSKQFLKTFRQHYQIIC